MKPIFQKPPKITPFGKVIDIQGLEANRPPTWRRVILTGV